MATAVRYFDLVREMKDAYNHRLRLVESAKKRGIKPTARLFATTVPTVRKWLRRFEQRGPSGLVALSRARHHQAQKTPPTTEAQLVELRKTLHTFGSRRLIREFDLPISHRALERIWREHGLLKKRQKKYQRKQDLAHIKAQWALFQQISADTKDLDDIPRYWAQAQRLHLPVVQYTAREVRSGLLFWAFAGARSASASAVFASRIQRHLDRYGVSLRDLVWQTDNGAEFKGDFPKALGDSQHVRIPPAAHTYQSDVETVHRLEEDEFFDLEDFSSRGEFLAKVHTYQLYFNLARPNSHKGNQSPWQIIERLAPRSPIELCLLPPVFLDYHLNDSGGYDVGRLPYLSESCGAASIQFHNDFIDAISSDVIRRLEVCSGSSNPPPGVSPARNSRRGGTSMNPHDSPGKMRFNVARPVSKPSQWNHTVRTLRWTFFLLLLLTCAGTWGQTKTAREEYVRASAPKPLTFDELVELEKTDEPSPQLAARLDKLLHSPFLSNEAFYDGAKPHRPSSDALGPFLRATMWNIERGIQLDGIRISLTQPEKFGKYIEEKKDAKSKPLTTEQLEEVKNQLEILNPTDLFILNEVDYGVTRTDYHNVARELAQALKMNYAYAVEFLEIDPLSLGLEKVVMDDKAAQADIQKSFEPDKGRYLGMHGTAVLSRYPVRKATIKSLPVCYDWFLGEKKEISKLEAGKRKGANLAFMERIAREVRRGGRTALIVELVVPESPTGAVTVVAPHLETKCKPECRRKQMAEILGWIRAEKNPVILAGDFNTSASDTSPTSVSKVVTERLKDPDKWAVTAIKWSTGAPTILLMPVNMMRNKNDPTGFDVPLVSRKKEAKLFGDLEDYRFEDGYSFDFRGEDARSADNKGGTLSDSNQRATKGFRYTFALARTYGGLVGEYKLDWFFVKGYVPDNSKPGGSYKFAPHFARTLQEVNNAPDAALSDHFPITVDIPLAEPPLKTAQP